MKMNKKRPFKQKFLKLFWTHVFVILSFIYLVSSDINDLKQTHKISEKNGVSVKKISTDQNMCNECHMQMSGCCWEKRMNTPD